MIKINENDYGIISVDRDLLLEVIYNEVEKMNPYVFACTKKGRPFVGMRRLAPDRLVYPVEITKRKDEINVRVYVIVKFGESIKSLCDVLFDRIEEAFNNLSIPKPATITIYIRGIYSKQLSPRNIEVTRKNDK